MAFNEYDVVRLTKDVPLDRVDRSASDARQPVVGDVGTVLIVHVVPPGAESAYIVECVDASGGTTWMADVLQSELVLVRQGDASAA